MAADRLIRTGIKGLDRILRGGIPRPNVILIEGTTGSGKTLLGTEFIYRGITEFDQPGVIVVFEAKPDKLVRDAATLGLDLAQPLMQGKLQIVSTSPQALVQELLSANSVLLETAREMGAHRIFIDDIGRLSQAFTSLWASSAAIPGAYHDVLQHLVEELNRNRLTALLAQELGDSPAQQAASSTAESLADTVIRLKQPSRRRRLHRSIEVVKSRGQEYDPGEHTLVIQNREGLEVYRRVQAPLLAGPAAPASKTRRSLIGVEALDSLIGGGIFDGSITLVVGRSGVGKTVLGTQLLQEGALRQNQRGLLVSLDEQPAEIIRNAETLGLNLQSQVDNGSIHILSDNPQELSIDVHFAKIVRTMEQYRIERLVIDGMASYSAALSNKTVCRDFFHALAAYGRQRRITTFFNCENPEVVGPSVSMPDSPVTSIAENIILLNMAEANGGLRRGLTVVKARGTAHEFGSREYIIGQGGIAFPQSDLSATMAPPRPRLSLAPGRLVGVLAMGSQ